MKVTDLLRTMDIFEHLPSEELEKIARLLRERRLTEDQVLCREGEPGDAMFIVTGGKIRLGTANPNGSERVLTYFTDGQFFGEMSLLTSAPRSATATAEAESRVLVLQKDDFDELLSTNAQIMREMLRVVTQRTLATNQQLLAEDGGAAASVGAGRIYAIFSPRGGSGKTTLAVNLATLLAKQMPERVALLDLNLTFGHAALLLNASPQNSLASIPGEVLEKLDRSALAPYLTAVPPTGLQLLSGSNKPEDGEAVTGDHVRAALAVMKRQFMAVVVDCGPNFSDPTLAALEMADRVILLGTPELNALRDIREVQRIFGEVIHVDRHKPLYVLNFYQPFKVLTREQFEEVLEQPVQVEIPHAGDAAIKAALMGEPMILSGPGSPFARSIEKLALELLPADARDGARGRGRSLTGAGDRSGGGIGGLFRRG